MSVYEELKGWQGAIGSLLGFLALMAAALWNFHLNRRRDARLRAEEAVSVAAALYGEIILLRKEAARIAVAVAAAHVDSGTRAKPTTRIDEHFLEAHKLSEPMLYRALAPKIGLLRPDLIIAITEFHQNFQDARTWLPLLIEKDDRGYNYSELAVLRPARDAVKNVIPALRTIERLASIRTTAEEPNLGLAETVIEWEEELFSTPAPPN